MEPEAEREHGVQASRGADWAPPSAGSVFPCLEVSLFDLSPRSHVKSASFLPVLSQKPSSDRKNTQWLGKLILFTATLILIMKLCQVRSEGDIAPLLNDHDAPLRVIRNSRPRFRRGNRFPQLAIEISCQGQCMLHSALLAIK